MAIYHLSAKVISRSGGKSAVAGAANRSGSVVKVAAYRSAQALERAEDGVTYDFSRKQDVLHTEIMAPDHAPSWCHDREQLWNAVETCEKRKDAQLAREVECSLPRELSFEQQHALVAGFVKEHFTSKGMIADCAFHCHKATDGGDHPHVHMLLTMRGLEGDGFGKKERSWNAKPVLEGWRKSWAHHANQALERAGKEERIDHRSLQAQGVDRVAPLHDGIAAREMRARGIPADGAGNTARNMRYEMWRTQSKQAYQHAMTMQKRAAKRQGVKGLDKTHSHMQAMSMKAMLWQMIHKAVHVAVDWMLPGREQKQHNQMIKRLAAHHMHQAWQQMQPYQQEQEKPRYYELNMEMDT